MPTCLLLRTERQRAIRCFAFKETRIFRYNDCYSFPWSTYYPDGQSPVPHVINCQATETAIVAASYGRGGTLPKSSTPVETPSHAWDLARPRCQLAHPYIGLDSSDTNHYAALQSRCGLKIFLGKPTQTKNGSGRSR